MATPREILRAIDYAWVNEEITAEEADQVDVWLDMHFKGPEECQYTFSHTRSFCFNPKCREK
jgi:hypothetical protein